MKALMDSGKNITSQDIIRVQDKAMMAAHDAVAGDGPSGSTCPQLMTVAGNTAHLSLMGDTKCFVIGADLSISDPTEGIRGGFDAKDPGGRIGGPKNSTVGYIEVDDQTSGADLRNYTHCVVTLNPQDTVIMCSDGVGDSLDPAMRGLTPEDCGLEGKEWDSENSEHNDYRNKYQAELFKKILTEHKQKNDIETLSSEDISKALNQFVHDQTITRKMKALVSSSEPESKKDFPGKMDHAGMLVYTHP